MPDELPFNASTDPKTHRRVVQTHVRVLVRTHGNDELQLRSLLHGLRSQRDRSRQLWLDFVLVPTEPGAQEKYRELREGGWLVERRGVVVWVCACASAWID
jgi:hypothetical protein